MNIEATESEANKKLEDAKRASTDVSQQKSPSKNGSVVVENEELKTHLLDG